MNQEKYIGYLERDIANTMWPSGLCREERKPFLQVCARLEVDGLDSVHCSI
jgi:hypothetical protein